MTVLRVLALTRYGRLGASSRLRFFDYAAGLGRLGIEVHFNPLFDDETLTERYRAGRYSFYSMLGRYFNRLRALVTRDDFDLLWIEKESIPWAPFALERFLLGGVPYVLDYDDAVFHNYDQHRLPLIRQIFGRRLDRLMADAALVVGGNAYLCARATTAGAVRVEFLPTVIDLLRYPREVAVQSREPTRRSRIVWIGSPSTARYLQELASPLQKLAQSSEFILRVIGATVDIPGVTVEHVRWSEDAEVRAVAECDIGLMPLMDSPWERGKCGYKLIQYMACGLPVVASPVGANVEIVTDGINGLLADQPNDWIVALEHLITQPELRRALGEEGRRRVETIYCLQVTAPRLATFLKQAAARRD